MNPSWRNLQIPMLQSVVITLETDIQRDRLQRGGPLGRQGLTEDAMPLQRASLGQIAYDAHTVASLPTIITAEIWIAAVRTH